MWEGGLPLGLGFRGPRYLRCCVIHLWSTDLYRNHEFIQFYFVTTNERRDPMSFYEAGAARKSYFAKSLPRTKAALSSCGYATPTTAVPCSIDTCIQW